MNNLTDLQVLYFIKTALRKSWTRWCNLKTIGGHKCIYTLTQAYDWSGNLLEDKFKLLVFVVTKPSYNSDRHNIDGEYDFLKQVKNQACIEYNLERGQICQDVIVASRKSHPKDRSLLIDKINSTIQHEFVKLIYNLNPNKIKLEFDKRKVVEITNEIEKEREQKKIVNDLESYFYFKDLNKIAKKGFDIITNNCKQQIKSLFDSPDLDFAFCNFKNYGTNNILKKMLEYSSFVSEPGCELFEEFKKYDLDKIMNSFMEEKDLVFKKFLAIYGNEGQRAWALIDPDPQIRKIAELVEKGEMEQSLEIIKNFKPKYPEWL